MNEDGVQAGRCSLGVDGVLVGGWVGGGGRLSLPVKLRNEITCSYILLSNEVAFVVGSGL